MALRLVLATHNPGKVAELRRILAGLDVELLSAADVDLPDVVEDGEAFTDNALLKARAGALASGLLCASDDSGIVVDALDGEPGVHSARYAGAHGNDEANTALVLTRLGDATRRSARFICVAALAHPDGRSWTTQGVLEGVVTAAPRGSGGFGYDPIFQPLGDSRTAAELTPQEKDAISHRGQAFRDLRPTVEMLARSR